MPDHNPHGLAADLVHLSPDSIQVNRTERQRSDITTENLLESIRRNGIIKPIIVERESLRLVAGERRLQCAIDLGLPTIPVRFVDSLDELERQVLEFDENFKRRALSWQDTVRTVARIHQVFLTRDPGWLQNETAEQVGVTQHYISMCLRIAKDLHDKRVSDCNTFREAYGLLTRRDERAVGTALGELLEAGHHAESIFHGSGSMEEIIAAAKSVAPKAPSATPTAPTPAEPSAQPQSIITTTFQQWVATYIGPKFNFIHCDFPYGIGVFDGDVAQGLVDEQYDDTSETYFALLETLCASLPRIMTQSAHIIFWYSGRNETATRKIFAEMAPQIQWASFPLIWHKSDGKSVSGDYRRNPRHVYETALMGYTEGRNLVRGAADCYAAPTDRTSHVSAKPEPMLRHFMSMIVDEHTNLLDPTCGAGSALRAAESLGANSVLGIESDPATADNARSLLQRFRVLRRDGTAA